MLLLTINLGFASDNAGSSNSQESNQEQQDGRKSGDSMIRPDGDSYEAQEQELDSDDKQSGSSYIDRNESVGQIPEKADSVEDDSVSKYNFIFYFLYKFKYDSEESP